MKNSHILIVVILIVGTVVSVASAGGGNYNNYSSFFNRDSGALILVNSTDTIGNSANRIPKIWLDDLDTTNITIGGASSAAIDMGGFAITNAGIITGTNFIATSTTATSTFAAGLTVDGYTMLGSDAPAVKFKKFNGTTDADTQTDIAIGIDETRVLAFSCKVTDGSVYHMEGSNTVANHFYITINGTTAFIQTVGTNLQSNLYECLMTYEE